MLRSLSLCALIAVPCAARQDAELPGAASKPIDEPAQQLPPPFSLSLRAAHTFDADIDGAGSISSSGAGLRFVVRQPVSHQLSLGLSLGASVRHDDFKGDSGLVPGSSDSPWDSSREYSLGVSALYRATPQLLLIAALNGSSSGEEDADFEDTLTGGVSTGFTYSLSQDLTLGFAATAQTRLEDDLFILPFPTINWALPTDPQRRWRLQIGHVPGGPPAAAGAAIVYAHSQRLSFFAGVGAAGLGADFRLDEDGPAPGGVARGRSFPLIAGFDWRPSPSIHLSAFAGATTLGEIELLDANGHTLGKRDVDPAPTAGLAFTWQF